MRHKTARMKAMVFTALIAIVLIIAGTVDAKIHASPPMLYADSPTIPVNRPSTVRVILAITKGMVDNYCSTMQPEEVFIVASVGGSILDAIRLGKCIAEADASLIVVRALSIAPSIVLHSKKVCFTTEVEISMHQPSYPDKVMDRSDMLVIYGRIRDDLVDSGIHLSIANLIITLSDLAPAEDTYSVPPQIFASMLGDSFMGICEMDEKVQRNLKLFSDKW